MSRRGPARRLDVVAASILLASVLTACTAPPPSSAGTTTTVGSLNPTTGTVSTTTKLMNEAQAFAFRVRNTDCDETGSSFATAQGIVTNRHVASGASTLQLSAWDGTDFNASVQAISEEPASDLAVLLGGSTKQVAPVSTTDVPGGTQVWAAGYPEGDQLTLTPGIVIDYISGSIYDEPGQIMEITNPIQPGNSGSPLLNSQGQVVGVVFAVNSITGNGLAIPTSDLAAFLSSPGSDVSGGCIG